MSELKRRIDEVAGLMTEFSLQEAEFSGPSWAVRLKKKRPVGAEAIIEDHEPEMAAPASGTPITSPMAGIFYRSPTPAGPPFVREGDEVAAGQVVALIEAMKVLNEITAPAAGKVTSILATSGQLVQPGEPLLYLE